MRCCCSTKAQQAEEAAGKKKSSKRVEPSPQLWSGNEDIWIEATLLWTKSVFHDPNQDLEKSDLLEGGLCAVRYPFSAYLFY